MTEVGTEYHPASFLFFFACSSVMFVALNIRKFEASTVCAFGRVGLRRAVQVRISSDAWVRIPQGTIFFGVNCRNFFFNFKIKYSDYASCMKKISQMAWC